MQTTPTSTATTTISAISEPMPRFTPWCSSQLVIGDITKAMMDAAIKAVDDYQSQVTGINSELQSEIDGLIPSSFSGAAANGFKAFYDTSILPNVTDNLTKMLDSLKEICNTIKMQIPGDDQGVDDQLGQGNQNSGSAQG